MIKVLSLLILVSCMASEAATSHYASPTGLTGNTGLSQASPWPLWYAQANGGANSTVWLMDGLYATNVDLENGVTQSGMTFKSLNKWGAGFQSSVGFHTFFNNYAVSNVVVDGIHFIYSYQSDIDSAGGIIVRNCWIAGAGRPPGWVTNGVSGGDGIYISPFASTNTPQCIVEYSLIESNGALIISGSGQDHGIYCNSTNTIIRGNVIRYNLAYAVQIACGTAGCIMTGDQVYNNLIYGNGDHNGSKNCLVIDCNESGGTVAAATNWVWGNTLINNGNFPVAVCNRGTVYFTNNVIIGGHGGGYSGNIDIVTGLGYADYNVVTNTFSGSGAVDGGHNIVVSPNIAPLFVNTNTGLYWLSTASSARAAANTAFYGLVDFFGAPQASITDVGAFQYSSARASDSRTLDPSPAGGADYWAAPAFPFSPPFTWTR
jgi:hypothetical protein